MIATYAAGQVSTVSIVLAWLFVLSRAVHTYVHLGSNNVTRRFFTYGFGLAAVVAIWAHLLFRLVT